ncbi:MAG: hypothetical protein K6E91_02150 [Butyrivibrio sp.]|nr:hypothetical protein [Butyrivibrio sp.]
MEFLTKNRKDIKKINSEVNKLTDFDRIDNPFDSFVPRQYGEGQQRRVEPTISKAVRDNQLIGYALENSESFNLDVTKKARLHSMRRRNTAAILLNTKRYRKDSPLMEKVKTTVEEVEAQLAGPVWGKDEGKTEDEIARNRAISLEQYAIRYQEAIAACRDYIKDRNPSTPMGIARYNLVLDNMNNMMDEMNCLSFAKQMVFRGLMGKDTATLRDLLVETKAYMNTSAAYTDKEKDTFTKAHKWHKSYYYFTYDIKEPEYEAMTGELRLFYDAVKLNVPADMLVKDYGSGSKDKKYAKNFLISLRDTLKSFQEGTKTCTSFLMGDYVINIFQNEDGSLSIGYCYKDEEGNLNVRQENIGFTAGDLAHKLGINMIENEKVFGKSNTRKLISETKPVKDETSFIDKSRYAETASAYLRTRLGIPNIKLTNIPAKEIVRLARWMESGKVSPEQTLEKINDYEYGDKNARAAEHSRQIADLSRRKRQLDNEARADGLANMKALDDRYREKELLDELTREENEKELKKKQERDELLAQQQAQNAQQQAQNAQQQGQNAQNQEQQQAQNVQNQEQQQDQNAQNQEQQQARGAQNQELQQDQVAQNQHLEQNQQAVQDQQPQIQVDLPQDAIQYEAELAAREQQIRQDVEDAKDAALTRHNDELLNNLNPQKARIEERLTRFGKSKSIEEQKEVIFYQNKTTKDTVIKDMDELKLKKEDELQLKLEEDLKLAEERFGDQKEELEKEKDRLRAEFDDNILKLDIARERAIARWCDVQDSKLTRRTDKLERRLKKASDDLADINKKINEENLRYEEELREAEALLPIRLAEIQKDRETYNIWKEYYIKDKSRHSGKVLDDFQVVEKDGDARNYYMSFTEWKARLVQDAKKREEEQIAHEALKERHDNMVIEYREVRDDLEELKESDLPTITDFRVNGEDTLDLMRLRKKYVENGTLADKVSPIDDYDEKVDKEKQEAFEAKRDEAALKREMLTKELQPFIDQKNELEKILQDNIKEQEAIARKKDELLALVNDKEEKKAQEKLFSEEEIKAIDEMAEKTRAIIVKAQEEAKTVYVEESVSLDQRVSEGKVKKEFADRRKQELLKDYSDKMRIGDNILHLFIDEFDETIKDKLPVADEFYRAVTDIEEQTEARKLSRKNAKAALDNIWLDYEKKLQGINDRIKKIHTKEENIKQKESEQKRRESEEKLTELELKGIALHDEETALNGKIEKLDIDIREKQGNINRQKAEYDRQDKNAQEVAQRRKERSERIAAEKEAEEKQKEKEKEKDKGRPTWSLEEENLLEFASEVLYATDTWDMDNEASDAYRLLNIMKKYGAWIGRWMSDPDSTKYMLGELAEKLPLQAFGVEKEFFTKDLLSYIQKGHEYLAQEVQKQRRKAREREEKREEKRAAKRTEIEERKKRRSEERKKQQDVIDDLLEEENDLREEEAEKKAEEYALKAFLGEHEIDGMAELEAQADKYAADKLMEQKRLKAAFQAKASSFFSFFINKAMDGELDDEEEEKKEVIKQETDQEKRVRLRAERKMAREARKAERERLDALEDLEWEKEIQEAGADEYSEKDSMLLEMADSTIIRGALEEMPKDIEDPMKDENFQKLLAAQRDMDVSIHKFLRQGQDKVAKFINKNLGGMGKADAVERVPYYREADGDERKQRIDRGNEQLGKMIKNAMVGEEGEGQFVRNVLSQYLGKSSIIDVRSMFASAIRSAKPVKLSEDATDEEKFKAVAPMLGGLFKGAGPLLQKILQGMPDSMIPKGLEDAFEDTKSNLAPIPQAIVEAQLLSMVERSDGRIKRIDMIKSLGAASVGQAFLCRVHTSDSAETVVIKLLRPDVRNRMLREKKIMQKCASQVGKGMEKTYNGLLERYMEELDLTIEARNTELGRIYDIDNNISSMKVSSLANPTPNSMIVTKAPGDTIVNVLKKSRQYRDDLLGQFYQKDEEGRLILENENPKLVIGAGTDVHKIMEELSAKLALLQRQQEKLCKLATKWVDEAVFGEGYYHGDLHAGNIMMSDDKLTVIDFGNATKLDAFQQEKITLMLMAAAAGSGSGFYQGFVSLLSKDSQKLLETKSDELAAVFGEVMKLGDFHSSAERIYAALVRAQKLGFELPPSIYGFQQCQIRLQNTIESFNKEIREMQRILKELDKAEGETILDAKVKYDKLSSGNSSYANSLRMVLLSDREDDLRPLLQSRDKDVREKLKELFKGDFGNVKDIIFTPPSSGVALYLDGGLDGINRHFYGYIEKLVDRQAFDSIFTGHGFNMANDGRTPEVMQQQFEDHMDELPKEEKQQIIAEVQELIKPYDILGTLDDLWTAQDEGKSQEEIKDLEDKALRCIIASREKYTHIVEGAVTDRINKKKITENAKQAEHDKYDQFFDKDKLFAPMKEKLMNPESLAQAENELKPLFENPFYGKKLDDAFKAYRDAPADAENRGELLDNLLEAYRMPAFMTLKSVLKSRGITNVDMGNPPAFVDVMGDVIANQWFEALKRVNVFKSIKYGVRIKGDMEGINLGMKETIKMAWKIIRRKE